MDLDVIINNDCIYEMNKLANNSVDLIIADPPYNLSKGGNWKWDNSIRLQGMGGNWTKIMENWDNMSFAEYFDFTLMWITQAKRILKPSGSMWVFGTYHNIGIINFICQMLTIEIINEVIWYKRNAFPNLAGRRLTASHETILWVHNGQQKREYLFNYEYTKHGNFDYDGLKMPGKQMRTVWDIPNNKQSHEILYGKHPTQKPLRLIKRLIELSSKPDDVIVIPFAGSGSECLAAFELGRHFIGYEIDEQYVKIANKRLEHANCVTQFNLFPDTIEGA